MNNESATFRVDKTIAPKCATLHAAMVCHETKKPITMKYSTLILFVFLGLISCNKKDDAEPFEKCIDTETIHREKNGAILNLTRQEWDLKENNIGGIDVGVKMYGSIQGDSASIRTYGDGLIYDAPIRLNSHKEFKQYYEIFFTSNPLPENSIIAYTLIMVYSGVDTLKVHINSCPIQNIHPNPE